jgi:hypothetical protein
MNAASLIARMREQRERWVEVAPGKRVKIRRPAEAEYGRFARIHEASVVQMLEHVRQYVVGWEGITEADLIGTAVGSEEPVAFTAELWAELISDRVAWVQPIMDKLVEIMNAHQFSVVETEKN